MTGLITALERGLWRGFAAVLTTGAIVWAIDRAFGRRP